MLLIIHSQSQTLSQALLLFSAAVVAGAINGVAGGGSFIAFPALIFTGVPPIAANATNNAALWVGTLASVGAYRKELSTQRSKLLLLGASSIIGGVLGSLALLHTSQTLFTKLIPYLLLLATLLFTFSQPLTNWVRGQRWKPADNSPASIWSILLLQLAIATYGGFFGGGIGILMLATLSVIGIENIHEMNALKVLLACCINGIALIAFIFAGIIVWPLAVLMSIGALLGWYLSAHYARQLKPALVRRLVIVVGFSMTTYFFLSS